MGTNTTCQSPGLTDHGGSSSQGGPGALVEVISCHHASVRHLEAGVNVDPPRHHHPPMSLDGLNSSRNYQVVSNLPEDPERNRG